MHAYEQDIELLVKSANRRLSELLQRDEMLLATGGTRTLEDRLWVWGIVGGKEVGKSTLINALAGGDVVDRGAAVGEGTFRPEAYLSADDVSAFRSRFTKLDGISITCHADAPDPMRGLVLIDMPDFDSLFTDHVTQVRRMAGLLDGIIWVTTPKKVGDLRAGREIRRVLKHRTNFVYVVNKMDWLLAQTHLPPEDELDRMSAALGDQVRDCDPAGGFDRTFAITAKYRTAESILEMIAARRDLPDVHALGDARQPLDAAVARLLGDFQSLKHALTTAPTAETAAANKRANLAYQTRAQAEQLLDHYRPRAALDRLQRVAGDEAIEEVVARSLPEVYCAQLIGTLNSETSLFVEWSAMLFKQRIVHWPLLGIIAWPIALIGVLLGGLRAVLGTALLLRRDGPPGAVQGDPFRFDGLSLGDRVEAIMAGVRARLASVTRHLKIELVDAEALTQQFRSEVHAIAEHQRSAVITPFLNKRPTLIGRMVRWVLPFAVLLWFPLVQPVLAGVMDILGGGVSWDMQLAATVVHALSAAKVWSGLCVSLLLLAATVAAVYSVAVRDCFTALDHLRRAPPGVAAEPLIMSLVHTIQRPIEEIRARLSEAVTMLENLADKHAPA